MAPVVTVVGLGPAGPELLTAETRGLLEGSAPVWLRTTRHPAAEGLRMAGSFDDLYESLDSFEAVYATIVERLVGEAITHGSIVYAVPGSPVVAEHTVELLRKDERIWLDVRPAVGFTDLCWAALGIDPMAHAVTIVDAHRIRTDAAGRLGPMLITQVHSREVLEDVVLALDDVAPEFVTVLQGLGTDGELVREVPWQLVTAAFEPDHLTTLWLPRLAEPLASAFVELDEQMRNVALGSCLDESTHDRLRLMVKSSADEVDAAIRAVATDSDDAFVNLEDALGRQLQQLFLLARMAAEAGQFTVFDVAQSANESLGHGNGFTSDDRS